MKRTKHTPKSIKKDRVKKRLAVCSEQDGFYNMYQGPFKKKKEALNCVGLKNQVICEVYSDDTAPKPLWEWKQKKQCWKKIKQS